MTMTHRKLRALTSRLAGTSSAGAWPAATAAAFVNVAVAFALGFRETAILLLILTILLVAPAHLARPRPTGLRSGDATPTSADRRTGDDAPADVRDYTEDLELTVMIGATADDDQVYERRSTQPHREVRQRQLTLITPYAEPGAGRVTVLPRLRVDDEDVSADWHPLREVAGRGAVVFTPPATDETVTWELSYDMPGGIWNPLRSTGIDVFRYDVREFPIGRFTVRFILHSGAESAFVQERAQRGRATNFTRDQDGRMVAVWTADSPAQPAKYEWDLRVAWRS
jgi:YD repeat-containing protein